MTNVNWIETSNCASRVFCESCLHDDKFRKQLKEDYKWDGKCPHDRLNRKPLIKIGSIVHFFLKRFEYPGCQCTARSKIMDQWGLIRSIRNWKIINSWLKEALHERKSIRNR